MHPVSLQPNPYSSSFPLESLPDDLIDYVGSYVDRRSKIVACSVCKTWEQMFKRVLGAPRQLFVNKFQTMIGHVIDFLDEKHFPLRYGLAYPREKAALQQLISDLNKTPTTIREIADPSRFACLKMAEILKEIPETFFFAVGNSIIRSEAAQYFNEEDCGLLKKGWTSELNAFFNDPSLLSLMTLKQDQLINQRLFESVWAKDEQLVSLVGTPETAAKLSALVSSETLILWSMVQSVSRAYRDYNNLLTKLSMAGPVESDSSHPLTDAIQTNLSQLLSVGLFPEAQTLMKYLSDGQSISTSAWKKPLLRLVGLQIAGGDFESVARLVKGLPPKLLYKALQEMGQTHIDLHQMVYLESLIDELGAQNTELVAALNAEDPERGVELRQWLIQQLGIYHAQEHRHEQALLCLDRLDLEKTSEFLIKGQLRILKALIKCSQSSETVDELVARMYAILNKQCKEDDEQRYQMLWKLKVPRLLCKKGAVDQVRRLLNQLLPLFRCVHLPSSGDPIVHITDSINVGHLIQYKILSLLCKIGDVERAIALKNESRPFDFQLEYIDDDLKRVPKQLTLNAIAVLSNPEASFPMDSVEKIFAVIGMLHGPRPRNKALSSVREAWQEAYSAHPVHREAIQSVIDRIDAFLT